MQRKLLFITFVLLSLNSIVKAQELGVRFGNFSGNEVSIDGIIGFGSSGRLHADIAFGNGTRVNALWDFIYRPLGDAKGFSWYTGIGPAVTFGNNSNLGVAGEIGIEVHFNFPIAIGIDWRPTLNIIQHTSLNTNVFGLNLRYIF